MQRKAFTLVELIVVITILAILWTIAFISLQWYSRDARDSTRISDLSKIKTSIELFHLNSWKYPDVSNPNYVTFSWVVAWTQWDFWNSTLKSVTSLDRVPKDPFSLKEYTYSITNTKQEFQLAWIMEGWDIWYLKNYVNAADKTAKLKIIWNYNWKVLKVSTGSYDYVLAVPSIITSTGFTIESIAQNDTFAYDWYKNLPVSYSDTSFDLLWDDGIDIVDDSNIVLFEGSVSDLSDSNLWWTALRANLISNIQEAYTWTILSNVAEISEILVAENNNVEFLASTLINNNLWWSIDINNISNTAFNSLDLCWETAWEVLYWTIWWWPESITCSNDIIVCSWTTWSWVIIDSCNAWANTTWTWFSSHWELFQWWNSAWVKLATTSSVRPSISSIDSSYSNEQFITGYSSWNATTNSNIWWDDTDTNEARRWPCDSWYHIPTRDEWINLFTFMQYPDYWDMSEKLLLPLAWERDRNTWALGYQNIEWYYWTSSAPSYGLALNFYWNWQVGFLYLHWATWYSVRCFKN